MSLLPGLPHQLEIVLWRCAPCRLTIYKTGVDYHGSNLQKDTFRSSKNFFWLVPIERNTFRFVRVLYRRVFFVQSRKSISDEKKLWFVFSPLFIGKRNFWSHQRCPRSNESGFHQINLFLKTSALAKNEHKFRSEMLKQRLTNATPLPPEGNLIEGSSNLRWSEITRGPRA